MSFFRYHGYPAAGATEKNNMKIDLKRMLYWVSLALPNALMFNYMIAAVYFYKGNGRLPRKAGAANATINDLIFHKMIRSDWSILEQFCVDKEFSKIFAAHASSVKVARTIATFSIDANDNVEDFVEWLKPFQGKRLIAKPTHGSGRVLFLDGHIEEGEIREFFAFSKANFFHIIRETQYRNLEKKIIVEDILPLMRTFSLRWSIPSVIAVPTIRAFGYFPCGKASHRSGTFLALHLDRTLREDWVSTG